MCCRAGWDHPRSPRLSRSSQQERSERVGERSERTQPISCGRGRGAGAEYVTRGRSVWILLKAAGANMPDVESEMQRISADQHIPAVCHIEVVVDVRLGKVGRRSKRLHPVDADLGKSQPGELRGTGIADSK